MLISTRGRYALRVLTDMAEHPSDGYLKLKDVAERQNISEKYLESIVQTLVKGGILTGARGKMGGYRFNRPPEEITTWEVLSETEGSLVAAGCQKDGAEPCERQAECRSVPLWRGLDKAIRDYLSQYTVADLVRIRQSGEDII